MSLEADLLKDLDSESDYESELEQEIQNNVEAVSDEDVQMTSVGDELSQLGKSGQEVTTSDLVTRVDIDSIQDITKISKLRKKLGPILDKIDQYLSSLISKKEEYDFLISVNDLILEITNEASLVYTFIKGQYSKRFPELSSLISNPVEYAKTIKILGNDLDIKDKEVDFLTKEKVLVLTMAIIQSKYNDKLDSATMERILNACNLLLELDGSKTKISDYIISRLAVFAPNLTSIVGPSTSAQLLSILGGLNTLAKTPSCNIAALGTRKNVGIGFGHNGIRQQGFLYYSDFIQSVSPDLRKQAMRIISGKIILAARVDLTNGSPNGELGEKWRKEIQEKINKLEVPPEIKAQKALPIPVDRTAKKRGGKRQRKLKQRYEASELRKAQNRVEFGKREATTTDAYGEEIGLGMSGALRMDINMNTNAKVSKKMSNRLKSTGGGDELFRIALANPSNTEKK